MIILGIETSCDETAASVIEYDPKRGDFFINTKKHKLHKTTQINDSFKILSNVVSSQVKIHAKYGGIVPEVAARNHVVNIIPVIDQALQEFRQKRQICDEQETRNKKQETKTNIIGARDLIDAVAVTNGPGLITSLLVGVETAKTLAWAWGKPLIAVNHLEGHIYSAIAPLQDTRYKEQDTNKFQSASWRTNLKLQTSKIHTSYFPVVALIVSGGHTQLVLMKDFGKYEVIGETRDDAAGEAFDKVAKLLGLGYPGGPIISAKAEEFEKSQDKKQETRNKDTKKLQIPNNKFQRTTKLSIINYQLSLPRPMIDSNNFDFSFSGLKTAVLYLIKELQKKNTANIRHLTSYICAEFQQAVIDVLVAKTQRAANKYGAKKIILAGGVAANKELRRQFTERFGEKLLLPGQGLSTDNAAMIAMAGAFHYLKKDFVKINKVMVDPNLEL